MHALEGSYAGKCGGCVVNSNDLTPTVLILFIKCSVQFTLLQSHSHMFFMLSKSKCVSQVRAPGFDGLAGENGL